MDRQAPEFWTVAKLWFRLGFAGFGGPAAQIAWIEEELVNKRGWIERERFRHALGFCMALPGPEATQLAVYAGWLMHGVRGGIAAALGFVLPGALLLWALSWLAMAGRTNSWIMAGLTGLQPAVLGILAVSLARVAGRRHTLRWIAPGTFLAMLGGVPYAAILLIAAIAGWVFGQAPSCDIPSTRPLCKFNPAVLATGLAAWLFPVAVAFWSGQPVLGGLGFFLSQVSMLTFGGAYAILPLVAHEAVEVRQWLPAGEMITGLGLAETTPGPLILVLQYVGFATAWHQPGALPPWLAGTLGAALASWVTFTPAVVLVLATAPLMERVRTASRWQKALQGISTAVTGMIGFLAVWFGTKVLVVNGSLDLWNLLAALVCGLLVLGKYPVERIVLLAVGVGLLRIAVAS